jgi:hypothetical protein
MDNIKTLTPEEISRQYSSTMDSVNLIHGGKPEHMSDEDWIDCVKRNKEHIGLMLIKDYWTTEDLTPFEEALAV